MYMNMCMIMTMNIYISSENEKHLRKEESMSGLINRLLDEHYSIARNTRTKTASSKEPVLHVENKGTASERRFYTAPIKPFKVESGNVRQVDSHEKNASGATPKMTISSSDVPMTADNPHQLKEVLRDDYTLCKHGMDPQFCKHAKPGQKCK